MSAPPSFAFVLYLPGLEREAGLTDQPKTPLFSREVGEGIPNKSTFSDRNLAAQRHSSSPVPTESSLPTECVSQCQRDELGLSEVLPALQLAEFLPLSYVRSWVYIKQISTPMGPLELKVPF